MFDERGKESTLPEGLELAEVSLCASDAERWGILGGMRGRFGVGGERWVGRLMGDRIRRLSVD